MAMKKRQTATPTNMEQEDPKMAEETPQTPAGPTSEPPPDRPPPAADPVPTIEEALASLGAPQIFQSGHDGRARFQIWLDDFMKKNPDALKSKEQIEEEKAAKEAAEKK